MSVQDKVVVRIDAVQGQLREGRYGPDDADALAYIRSQITPSGIAVREPDENGSRDVTHLVQAANIRLKPYEKEIQSA